MKYLVKVSGRQACFTNPLLKSERASYDVMTPSAARGIMDSIYWHNYGSWNILGIHVCHPIKFSSARSNVLKSKLKASAVQSALVEGSESPYINGTDDRTQQNTLMLTDVEYVIEAEFVVRDKIYQQKVDNIIQDRLSKGRCYHTPFFGLREYKVQRFEAITADEIPTCPEQLKGVRDLGWMTYDWDYTMNPPRPLFYHPVMKDGYIDVEAGRSDIKW